MIFYPGEIKKSPHEDGAFNDATDIDADEFDATKDMWRVGRGRRVRQAATKGHKVEDSPRRAILSTRRWWRPSSPGSKASSRNACTHARSEERRVGKESRDR